MNAPLQLKKYYFTEISVKATPTPSGEEKVKSKASYNGEVRTERKGENEFNASVKLSLVPEDEKYSCPYLLDFTIFGHFLVAQEWPEDQKEKLVRIDGASMLLGAAREMITILTSRGPHGELILPGISFQKFVKPESKKEEVTTEKSSTKTKPAP